MQVREWKDLGYVLALESSQGFGFQVSEDRVYIGQIFMDTPDRSNGYENYELSSDQERQFLNRLHIATETSNETLWFTSFCGREFLTLKLEIYHKVIAIINSILSFVDAPRYRFLTHTSMKCLFLPGEVFSAESFEQRLIDGFEENYNFIRDADEIRNKWLFITQTMNFRPFVYEWNYQSQRF